MNSTIHRLFEVQAGLTPDSTAVIFENEQLSYAQLNARANQVAHHLRAAGVGPDTLVGICTSRAPAMLTGMLGILKAGGAYVALDPAYPPARLAFMIEDAAMPILLTQQDLLPSLPETGANLICLDSGWDRVSRELETNPEAAAGEHNLAYLLYTSGSTGRPKGVAIEHHSVVVFLAWAHSVFPPSEVMGTLAGTSICFDLSVFEIFVPITCGGAVILAENTVALPMLRARHMVTLINTVPSAISALVETGGLPENVRVVNLAGEPLSNKLAQEVYRSAKVEKVYNLYGPSEDTTYSTFVMVEKGAVTSPTIGKPITGTQAYIVDEHFQLVPTGTTGELLLGGDGLARGYLNRPELTEAKFIANPFDPGRIYRTGDLARFLPDGNIEFLGRMDYQVKVRGYRIELGEIETALEQHPAVRRGVVLALPDSKDRLQLAAWIVPNGEAAESLTRDQDTREYLDLWRKVYEDAYLDAPASQDPTFNTSGWLSSYTGAPIPEQEMREWLEATVERIFALRPKRVLEIGCGTGMLAVRVAPSCESYTGLDLSPAALDHIRSMQGAIPGLENVTLFERTADQLDDFETASFDTVIINSVVQHFPDADYLIQVLESATRLVMPGGHILVGDVINQSLREAFFASIHTHRAADSDTRAQVRERIRHHAEQGRDLMVAPSFFLALADRLPSISHVEARPKFGRFHNELTKFRYDVILHVRAASAETSNGGEWLDWNLNQLSIGEVRRRLIEASPERLAIRNIPNARLEREIAVLPWTRYSGDDGETIAHLRAQLAEQPTRGAEPDDLWALEDLGYRVEVSWLNSDEKGSYDAVLTQNGSASAPASFAPANGWQTGVCEDYTAKKQSLKLDKQLVPRLRKHLLEKLPPYMMPAAFTVIERLPLSPNGKLDRAALANSFSQDQAPAEIALAITQDPIEQLLLKAWADVLDLGQIGLEDNFFELGGNSLRAISLTHRLQKELNCPVRPVSLLQSPTVTRFSAWLREAHPGVLASGYAEMHEGEI